MFHPQGPTFWELARQALSSTERGYDLLAPKFDHTPFRTPDFVLQAAAEVVARRGEIRRGLDVCCGTGAGMEMLRPLCQHVVGLDVSQGMLGEARRRSELWEGAASLEFARGNALAPPDFQEKFDVAVCFGALGHIRPAEESKFLAAIFNMLVSGGSFYFVTSTPPPWWSLRNLLSRGFNGAMHVRNLLIRPPFIMFYLTFLLPRIGEKLRDAGFEVIIHNAQFPSAANGFRLVEARRP